MPFQGIGNVQITKYGARVRVRVGYKDIYGPYRRTVDCARLDLYKLLEQHRTPAEKKAWLLQLKCSIGVRRGGRDRSYCRGNENADDVELKEAAGQPSSSSQRPRMEDAEDDEVGDESSDGAPEKRQIGLPAYGEQEEVPFYGMSSCTAVEVDREEEVPALGIPSCTTGSVGCLESDGVEGEERNRSGGKGVYQAMSSSALGSDEAAGQPSSSSQNPHMDDAVVLPLPRPVFG